MALVLSLLCGPAHGFGMGVAPMTIEMEVKPGKTYRQVVTVGNVDSDRHLAIVVGLADWDLTPSADLELIDPETDPESPAAWVRFSPAAFTLAPGESKQVRVDIDVPALVPRKGDFRFALVSSTRLPPVEGRQTYGSGVWRRYQMASLFYLTVPPAKPDPEVTGVLLDWTGFEPPSFALRVRNAGSRHARLTGDLRLVDLDGATVHAQPVRGVVLDHETRDVRVTLSQAWRAIPPGSYRVELDLDSESGRIPVRPEGELPMLHLGVLQASTP